MNKLASISRPVALLLFLLLSSISLPSHADVLNNLELSLRNEAKSIIQFYDIEAKITVSEDGGYISRPDGTVSIGLKRLRSDLKDEVESIKIYRLRWIIAHELWHQAQFSLYNSEYPSDKAEIRRLFECQADLVGAHYTASTIFTENVAISGLGAVADQLDTFLKMATSLSDDRLDAGSHPSMQQRHMAVTLGVLRALGERLSSKTEEEKSLLRMLQQAIEVEEDEDKTDWSYRLCKKIVHTDSDAVGALILKDETLPRSTDSSTQTYRLWYGNSSSRPINVRLTVQYAAVKYLGNSMPPFPLFSKEYVFDIAPGGRQLITGTISLMRLDDIEFAIIYPRTVYSWYTLVSAEFTDRGGPAAATNVDVATLGPSARELYRVMPPLVDLASEKFISRITGICTIRPSEKVCPVGSILDKEVQSRLHLKRNGESYIRIVLYSGKSRDDAMKALNNAKSDFLSIYPGLTVNSRYSDPSNPGIEIDVSRHAAIEIYMLPADDPDDDNTTVLMVRSTW
ncbi:hypothetical protein [Bosea sp. PAMC 26642]|uniref:hypothetical protein n=1 Tax=Bosea sp. (strain PAMC 26642) TaxID=1792307 RepID=UPI000B33C566|nr:hypothetical protein [Bosea sp. PAMC 26642]